MSECGHVISEHLGVFEDDNISIETFLLPFSLKLHNTSFCTLNISHLNVSFFLIVGDVPMYRLQGFGIPGGCLLSVCMFSCCTNYAAYADSGTTVCIYKTSASHLWILFPEHISCR